jgi:hypothetical protein
MLTQAVEAYVAMRRATGFAFRSEGSLLQSLPHSPTRRANSTSALKPPLSGLNLHHPCLNERAGLAR